MSYDPISAETSRLDFNAMMEDCQSAIVEEAKRLVLPDGLIEPRRLRPLEVMMVPNRYHPPVGRTLPEITITDVGVLTKLSLRLSEDASFISKVVVRTVFGASEKLPVRSLSYLLPALHLIESMRRSGRFPVLPQIQFLFMADTGAAINQLQRSEVIRQTDLFIVVARRFIEEFYPKLSETVIFATDKHFYYHPQLNDLVEFLLSNLEIAEKIVSQLSSDSRYSDSIRYSAFHPLVHDIGYTESLFEDEARPGVLVNDPEFMINIGGQREKHFYKVRQIYRQVLAQAGVPLLTTVQFFSSHRVPPYIAMEDDGVHFSDVSLEDAIINPSILSDILDKTDGRDNLFKRDLKLLVREGSTRFSLYDFLRRQNEIFY